MKSIIIIALLALSACTASHDVADTGDGTNPLLADIADIPREMPMVDLTPEQLVRLCAYTDSLYEGLGEPGAQLCEGHSRPIVPREGYCLSYNIDFGTGCGESVAQYINVAEAAAGRPCDLAEDFSEFYGPSPAHGVCRP